MLVELQLYLAYFVMMHLVCAIFASRASIYFPHHTAITIFMSDLSMVEKWLAETSVADPDPPDPHVFGPPGSGSTRQRYGSGSGSGSGSCKNSNKYLDFYYFVNLFDFLSLKNVVNVPSKSNKQKKLC